MSTEDPGYLADDVEIGAILSVTLPDGRVRPVVVLRSYPGGSVAIDYVDRVAELRAASPSPDPAQEG